MNGICYFLPSEVRIGFLAGMPTARGNSMGEGDRVTINPSPIHGGRRNSTVKIREFEGAVVKVLQENQAFSLPGAMKT